MVLQLSLPQSWRESQIPCHGPCPRLYSVEALNRAAGIGIVIEEAAMPILGKGRVIRHVALQAEMTERAILQIHADLFAQLPFRLDPSSSR